MSMRIFLWVSQLHIICHSTVISLSPYNLTMQTVIIYLANVRADFVDTKDELSDKGKLSYVYDATYTNYMKTRKNSRPICI